MLSQSEQRSVFANALELLQDRKFSLALKLAHNGARQFKLYDEYQSDFARIRVLAFEQRDFENAAFLLGRLLVKLSEETSVEGTT